MKRQAYISVSLLALAICAVAFGRAASATLAATPASHIAAPAYFYPGPLWQQLDAGAPQVRIAVMNPASGPGSGPDANYAAAVAAAQQQKVKVLGYVHTSYGQRPLATVEAEVDDYRTWYNVTDIFFDEASNDCTQLPYYKALHAYVKGKQAGAVVAINPGTATAECYMSVADDVVTFEGDDATYLNNFTSAVWTAKYSPGRFWHLVYDTPTTIGMQSVLALSRARGAGLVYVTPDALPNPWDTLPSGAYWTAELSGVVCKGIKPGSNTVVNVRHDAGAAGDGATDDSQAFKVAINTLATAGGGTLVIPGGTYLVSPSAFVNIPSGVTVLADGATIRAGQYGYALLGVQGNDICVSGLTVDGAEKVVRGIELGGPSQNVTIMSSTVENITEPTPSQPGYADNGMQVTAGIRIEGDSSKLLLDGVTVQNVVSVNAPTGGTVVAARGIWITPASGQAGSTQITVQNSTLEAVGPKDDGDCLVIQGSNQPATLHILNNTFTSCHKRAIKIQTPGVDVRNNQIENPFHGDNTSPTDNLTQDMYAAVSVYASTVQVTGNTIDGTGNFYNAVEIGADPCVPLTHVMVEQNSIAMGAAADVTGDSLVRLMAPIQTGRITGNVLTHAQYGLTLFPGSTGLATTPNTYAAVTTQVQTYGTPCVPPPTSTPPGTLTPPGPDPTPPGG
jgi:hypothetical protein